MNLSNRLNKFRRKKIGNYKEGNRDYNYKKALGQARLEEIEQIVKREIKNYAYARRDNI